jgi:hypothetical protein
MSYCSPDELSELWSEAGLGESKPASSSSRRRTRTSTTTGRASPKAPAEGAFTAALDPDRREELRAAVRRRLGEPSGAFTLTARAWFVRGTVI